MQVIIQCCKLNRDDDRGAFVVGLLYKKKYDSARKLSLLKLGLYGVLICYLVVVFGAFRRLGS